MGNNFSNKLIELRITAMANLTDAPATVVLMLSPKYDEKSVSNITKQIFPIKLSREEGIMYFRRLTGKLQGSPIDLGVEGAFMKHYSIMIDSVVIKIINSRISAEIHVVDQNGTPHFYEDTTSSAVLLAYFKDAPIFVEEYLLQEASKSLKMNFVDEHGEKLSPESSEKILQNAISNGADPNNLDEGIRLLLSESSTELRDHLKDFAIEKEFYEWAAFLTKFHSEDESSTPNNE